MWTYQRLAEQVGGWGNSSREGGFVKMSNELTLINPKKDKAFSSTRLVIIYFLRMPTL